MGRAGCPKGHGPPIGVVVFDELGYATTAIQTNTTSATPNGAAPENFLARFEITFTVNPDCTAKYTFRNVDPSAPGLWEDHLFPRCRVCKWTARVLRHVHRDAAAR